MSALTASSGEWLADWSGAGDACDRVAGVSTSGSASTQAATADAASASVKTSAAPKGKKTGELTQVGHEPLRNRGMNAAMAIHGDYAYIGSRTDGAHEGMPHGGIMVVDISDPSDPELLTEEPLYAATGESSRELRVWGSQEVLIVLNTNCGGVGAHHCTGPSQNSFRFYDISGENATAPRLIAEFRRAPTSSSSGRTRATPSGR